MKETKQELTEWRNVIVWEKRLKREGPFLEQKIASASGRGLPKKLLDVGCGSGEHCLWFAQQGWTTVGIDIKESMIKSANELAGPVEGGGEARFQLMDGAQASGLAEAPFGAAIYLGNGTAFMHAFEDLAQTLSGIARALAPGAPFLIQTLNYARIESLPLRALPVNVLPLPEDPEGDSELVFLRVLRPRPQEGLVTFFPIGLELTPSEHPGEEPPTVTVRSAKQLDHRAWKQEDFARALELSGFCDIRLFGGMQGEPFDLEHSHDLVILSRREP